MAFFTCSRLYLGIICANTCDHPVVLMVLGVYGIAFSDSVDLSIAQLGIFSVYRVFTATKSAASGTFPGGHVPELPQSLKSSRIVWVIGQN